jgi:hypothetical protein
LIQEVTDFDDDDDVRARLIHLSNAASRQPPLPT